MLFPVSIYRESNPICAITQSINRIDDEDYKKRKSIGS